MRESFAGNAVQSSWWSVPSVNQKTYQVINSAVTAATTSHFPPNPLRKELSFDEKIAKIQKYLPAGITEKILSQRDKIEGEKRQVTVMFCDMKGFTPLSEKLGPETMYAMMDEVYEILIHRVHRL